MSVKLLTEHNLEFLSLKGGCTGSSESTLVTLLEIMIHSSFVGRNETKKVVVYVFLLKRCVCSLEPS